jgi:hypothetical protein
MFRNDCELQIIELNVTVEECEVPFFSNPFNKNKPLNFETRKRRGWVRIETSREREREAVQHTKDRRTLDK